MKEQDGYTNPWAFDATKVWKHADYPLIEIGTIEINRNPVDYFSEVEQLAFSPANVVPGIGFSPDKLLQGRLFIYDDAQHHRIGPNFKQLPVNRRHLESKTPYLGGNMSLNSSNKFPHYYPSSFETVQVSAKNVVPPFICDGPANYYDPPGEGSFADYYEQPRNYLRIIDAGEKMRMCENIAASLLYVDEMVVTKVLNHFSNIDDAFAKTVADLVRGRRSSPATEGSKLVEQLNVALRPTQTVSTQ